MEPLVSVVVPVYNKEEFIRTCVDSVLTQTYKNIEIILVNDGSKDGSQAICEQIAETYRGVVLINQENAGVSAARNAGISRACGKYLMFLDADDTLRPDAVRVLVEVAEKSDSHLTIGRASERDDLGTEILEGEDFLRKNLEDNPMTYTVWRILYKLDFIKDISFPVGYVCHEDSYFTFLCGLKMPRVATVDRVVYNYNYVGDSVSRSSFTDKKYNDICGLLEKKVEIISEGYSHLLPLAYHLKVKIQMMLLSSLSITKGVQFRKKERETLAVFNQYKGYFQKNLPYSNAGYFNILDKKLYYPYKLYINLRNIFLRLKRK